MGLRDISIRKFRTEDAKAVANIMSKAENKEVTLKSVLTLSNNRKMYVALSDNKIIGTAGIDYDTIYSVYSGEEFGGKGVEEALISLLEEIASNHGIKVIKLEADSNLKRLYERLDYNVIGDGNTENNCKYVMMEKYLS